MGSTVSEFVDIGGGPEDTDRPLGGRIGGALADVDIDSVASVRSLREDV